MSEQQTQETEPATYDVHATERKWREVWDRLEPFRADDDAVARGEREKRYALTMFPYPSGDLHMGHAEVIALHDVVARYWRFRGYEVLNPMGWDSFGLPAENAAIRNDEHPATYTYANIETQYESMKQLRPELRLVPAAAHLRPGVLPLDPVAVPEVPRARPGLPQEQPGQLVPQRPDRAGQRAGRRRPLRALRRRGHQARADPVVLQDHRLRPAAAGRPGRRWTPPGPTGCSPRSATGSAAPRAPTSTSSVEGRDEPMTVYTTRPDTLFGDDVHGRRRRTPRWRPSWSPTSSGRRTTPTVEQVRRETEIDRLSTDRPKTGVFLGVHAVNPVNGERIPVWAADYVLADYGTGAIMAVPGQDQRDWEFAKKFDLPIVPHRAAARRTGRARPTTARARRSTPPTTRSR